MRHYGRYGRNKAIKKKKERDENMPKKKKKGDVLVRQETCQEVMVSVRK